MKKGIVSIVLVLAFLGIIIPASPSAKAEEYRVAPGDVLDISVWGIDELQAKEIIVRPDGKLAFPLAGEIQVAGLTPVDLTSTITTKLSDYVVDPKVTVNILKYHTTRIYVLGEIAKPGLYELEKQHNVLDALGAAGSYTRDAAKKKIFIIRKGSADKPERINLLNLLEKGDMTQNYALNDGDVVYLSKNGRIDFAKDILPWISALYQINEMND